MMMSDLPADLVEEILSRVPATSLKRLRSTCQRWNALSKNRRFSEKHFLEAQKQSLVILRIDYTVHSVSVNLKVASSIEFKGALSINNSKSRQYTVFHCDGLLLCTTKNRRLMVWNPCLAFGVNRWISTRANDKRFSTNFVLGYQNNQSCRNYKILRWRYGSTPNPHVVGLEIYEFCSDSWRVLDNVSLDCMIRKETGVSLKGNTYWLALENFLSSFDFTLESFKRLCLPPNPNLSHHKALSVGREEQLSVLYQLICSSTLEIWMSNTIGTEADLLWRKSFKVNFKIPSPYCSPICTSYVVVEEKKVVVCFNVRLGSRETSRELVTIAGEDVYIEIPYDDDYAKWGRPFIFNYVPSLVQVW